MESSVKNLLLTRYRDLIMIYFVCGIFWIARKEKKNLVYRLNSDPLAFRRKKSETRLRRRRKILLFTKKSFRTNFRSQLIWKLIRLIGTQGTVKCKSIDN